MQFMSSTWSAGDGNFFVEAVAYDALSRTVLYQSPGLAIQPHESTRDRVWRVLRVLTGARLSVQAAALSPGGIKELFEHYFSEDQC
jgi:hypothetical protein